MEEVTTIIPTYPEGLDRIPTVIKALPSWAKRKIYLQYDYQNQDEDFAKRWDEQFSFIRKIGGSFLIHVDSIEVVSGWLQFVEAWDNTKVIAVGIRPRAIVNTEWGPAIRPWKPEYGQCTSLDGLFMIRYVDEPIPRVIYNDKGEKQNDGVNWWLKKKTTQGFKVVYAYRLRYRVLDPKLIKEEDASHLVK